MRALIAQAITVLLLGFLALAYAGSYTVTTTPEQDALLATLKTTPQEIVSKRLDGANRQEEARKLGQLRRDCANKIAEACEKIQAATKGVK